MLMDRVMKILNNENRCCDKCDWCDEEGSVGAEGVKEGNETGGL